MRISDWSSDVCSSDLPELGIRKSEVGLDRFGKDIDDLPIEEIEDIDDQQNPQHRARLRGNAIGRRRSDTRDWSGLISHLSLPPPSEQTGGKIGRAHV